MVNGPFVLESDSGVVLNAVNIYEEIKQFDLQLDI
jgi:hypothetical protein